MKRTSITIALMASTGCLWVACHEKSQGPETPQQGYHAFLAAVKAGDSARIWSRLGPKTKKRMEKWAKWANEKSNADISAKELLLVDFPKMLPRRIKVVRRNGDEALVAPVAKGNHRMDLLVDRWLVRIQPLDDLPVTRRSGQVVVGPLGLSLALFAQSTTQETFHMVRRDGRWLVELELPNDLAAPPSP